MAGACAALAAREAGADTLLVARAPGATAMSSGAFDFASSEDDAPLAEAARRLGRRAGHPYALLGEDLIPSIDAAIDLLRRSLPELRLEGARTAADRNLWLATPLGLSKPAALAQGPIAAGDLRSLSTREGRLGVVALAGTQVVEARLVAKGLSELLAPLAGAVVVAADLYRQRADALRTLPEIAHDLDRPGRRAELIESLGRAAAVAHATALLLPTLGLADPVGARAEMERALGLPVFEALGAPPSVPGLRLQRALSEALEKAGVRVLQGIAEGAGEGQVQIVRGVECQPVRAGAVVLASGRFLGGGIRCETDGRLRETVLDLPVRAAGRSTLAALPNEDLFAQRAGGRHAGLMAGVEADSDLRSGSAFLCGAVLGGFDPAREAGGLGVCAVTGLVAGERAARQAGRVASSAEARR